jgi:hypothetical protein
MGGLKEDALMQSTVGHAESQQNEVRKEEDEVDGIWRGKQLELIKQSEKHEAFKPGTPAGTNPGF